MIPEKSDLLEKINTAINKKWNSGGASVFSLRATQRPLEENNDLKNKDLFSHSTNAASVARIEQRIEGLERQNNQLLHFIDFLVENLPDLVITILHTGCEKCNLPGSLTKTEEECKETIHPGPCGKNKEPCPTRRENDVLQLLIKGFCAKEIANRLFISETTVITHKKNLKEKFNAKNTAELISKVQKHISEKDNK